MFPDTAKEKPQPGRVVTIGDDTEMFFDFWTDEPIATNLGGEPAMTLVPNLWATGVLTAVASLAVLAWAVAGERRAAYGQVLILLSVVMLAGKVSGPLAPNRVTTALAGHRHGATVERYPPGYEGVVGGGFDAVGGRAHG